MQQSLELHLAFNKGGNLTEGLSYGPGHLSFMYIRMGNANTRALGPM